MNADYRAELHLPRHTGIGDIWALYDAHPPHSRPWVIIPTNMGWTQQGVNVMGRGLAKDAAQRFPLLPNIYGDFLRTGWRSGALTPRNGVAGLYAHVPARILCFPSKPLDENAPHLSWRGVADPEMIRDTVGYFATFLGGAGRDQVWLVPLIGAGNAGLDPVRAWELLAPLRRFENVRIVVHPTQAPTLDATWKACQMA